MDPPASFSSLPPELVTKICQDSVLGKQDLIALRLTSKSHGIHLSASKEFAKRYFNTIRLIYTRYSLQAFADICKHPIFGPAVRAVQLSYVRFLPDSFEEESKSLLHGYYGKTKSQKRTEYLDNIRLLVNRCEQQEDLNHTNNAEDLLTAAFTALSHWDHSLHISVDSDEACALGQKRTYSTDNPAEKANWQLDVLGTVDLLCRTATLNKCVIQRLQIKGDPWGNLVNDTTLTLGALAQIPELEFNFWCPDDMDIVNVSALRGVVIKLLENAVGLKTLDIASVFTDGHQYYLDRIFSIMPTLRLEKLRLKHVDLDRYKPFEERMDTLRRLVLVNCDIAGSLKNFLLVIQKNLPQLEYCFLSDISRSWISGKSVKFNGAQEVKDGLNKLIQSCP